MIPTMQPLKQTTRTHVRSTSNHLVVLGGVLRQQLSVSSQLRAYNEQEKEWIKLCEMKEPRYQHGIAVIGNFLFVVGGQVKFLNLPLTVPKTLAEIKNFLVSHSSCHTVLRVLANIIASIILSNWHYLEKLPTLLTQIVPEFIPNPTHIRKILKDSPSTSSQSIQLVLIWVVDTVVASLISYVGGVYQNCSHVPKASFLE